MDPSGHGYGAGDAAPLTSRDVWRDTRKMLHGVCCHTLRVPPPMILIQGCAAAAPSCLAPCAADPEAAVGVYMNPQPLRHSLTNSLGLHATCSSMKLPPVADALATQTAAACADLEQQCLERNLDCQALQKQLDARKADVRAASEGECQGARTLRLLEGLSVHRVGFERGPKGHAVGRSGTLACAGWLAAWLGGWCMDGWGGNWMLAVSLATCLMVAFLSSSSMFHQSLTLLAACCLHGEMLEC